MASIIACEFWGLSRIVSRKSPGVSFSSTKVMVVTPSSSGSANSARRRMNVRIERRSRSRARLDEHPVDVPEEPVRNDGRLKVPEAVPHRQLHVLRRQPDEEALAVDDLLDLFPALLALRHVGGRHIGGHELIDR